ncbi:collagen alpha-1(XII) chain-like [Mytilus californianus]|uniref:collagen alpha-1(XII) chain-like n=1 Tax=Mytilus californianus TaxID=6549 RepID=UPI0022453E47|nr:collagen alpha-1(XII) chain-like [Mytilus californianus]
MGLHTNLTSMLEAIEYIPNRLGSSQTDNALEWVFKHAFSKEAGNRDSVPNILIVLTDVYAVKEIQTLASGLQGHDMSVFVIGIGLLPDPSELAQIVTHQQGISPVSAYGTLWDLQIKLQDSVCQVTPTTTTTSTETIIPANCIDATYVKCDDIHICSDNALRQKCPVTCGLCDAGVKSTTLSWIHIVGK